MKYLYILLFTFIVSISFAQNESTLEWAVTKALENNYGIRISKLQKQSAEIQNTWGATGLYPNIGAVGTYSSSADVADPDRETNSLYGGVNLDWTLFSGFGAVISKDKYEELEKLANGNLATLAEQTIQQVSVAYFQLLLANEQYTVVQKQVDLSADLYNYQQERKNIGTAVTFDVLQAKTVWLENKSALVEQEIAIQNAKRNMALLLGIQTNDIPELVDSLSPQFTEYSIEDLRNNMVSSNKNIQNQYIQMAIKELDVKYAKSKYFPTLSANAGVGMFSSSQTTDPMPAIESDGLRYNYGVTLSIPIFTGGMRSRAVQLAKVAQEIESVSTSQMLQTLDNSLNSAYETYILHTSLVELANENKSATELNYELAQEKFKAGSINSFNLRDLQNRYLQSDLRVLQAKFSLLVSELELLRLSGNIIKEETNTENSDQ